MIKYGVVTAIVLLSAGCILPSRQAPKNAPAIMNLEILAIEVKPRAKVNEPVTLTVRFRGASCNPDVEVREYKEDSENVYTAAITKVVLNYRELASCTDEGNLSKEFVPARPGKYVFVGAQAINHVAARAPLVTAEMIVEP